MPILRCLFCNHVNPAEASFCNACGSQLDLQPCGQCGAVDSRTAKSCHKCGTPFTLALTSELDALLAPMSPNSPHPHADQWDYSSRIEASVAGAKGVVPAFAQPHAANDRQLAVAEVPSGRLVQPVKLGNSWLVPGLGLLAVGAAAMFAIFNQKPAATTPTQAAQRVATQLVALPAVTTPPPEPTTPAQVVQAEKVEPVEAASAPQDLPIEPTATTNKPEKMPARTAPRTVASKVVPTAPVTQAPPPARREAPAIANCSQALATLGLCNP